MTPGQPPFSDSQATLIKRQSRFGEDPRSVGFNSSPYARASDQESGTLLEYIRILARRKGTLLVFAVLSTLAAFLFTRSQPPMYRARTLLEMETLNENFLHMRNVSPTAPPEESSQSPESNIRTQIAVLQSRPVIERMLQKHNLEKRLLAKKKRYTFPWSQTQVASIRESRLLVHDQAVSIVGAALQVRPQAHTRLVEITFDSSDPQMAADAANLLITAFTEVSLENRWRSIQNTSEWLTRQVQDVKIKLEKSEDALQTYARVSGLTFLSGAGAGGGGENTTSEERLRQLQLELSKTEAERVAAQSRHEQATKAPADSVPEVVDNPTLREYQVQLTSLRRQLADLSSSFTSNYPKVISLRSQIAAIEAALERGRANVIVRTRNDYESAVRREQLVRKDYGATITLMGKEADKISHYSLLKREVDTTRQLYESMIQRVKEADLASAMKAIDIHVIESARPPQKPYKPVAVVNMGVGLLSGLCVGAMVIIQRARSNTTTRIQEPGEIAFELNVPELGVIPAVASRKPHPVRRFLNDSGFKAFQANSELTSLKKSPSVLTESFRLTLASILLSSKDASRRRVIAVTSATAGEGKTTLTSNLGITLARMNRRVLLIDGDLRKRRLHRIFEAENTAGLYEALTDGSTAAVKETKVPNLFLLPSGKGINGDTLFFTSKLKDLLESLQTEFDMILIDTPPLLQVADARLICNQADATVLVIAQHTPRETAHLVRQQLSIDGSHLLGTILNKWDPKASLHGYADYSSYYTSYYADEKVV
jgi:polysaccharide biosynthesis transport protein